MAGPWVLVHGLVAIVLLALVLIHDPDTNWRAQCDSKLCAGLNFDAILLVSGCCDGRLAGSAARHLGLNVTFGESHAWRAAVDDGANGKTVGFAIATAISMRNHKRRLDAYVVTRKCVPNVDMVVVVVLV